MDPKLIERINELANKSKAEGLTIEEKEEQTNLRNEYLSLFKANFRQQLSGVKKEDNKDDTID